MNDQLLIGELRATTIRIKAALRSKKYLDSAEQKGVKSEYAEIARSILYVHEVSYLCLTSSIINLTQLTSYIESVQHLWSSLWYP